MRAVEVHEGATTAGLVLVTSVKGRELALDRLPKGSKTRLAASRTTGRLCYMWIM